MSDRKENIVIGIPCYQNAPAETLEDYMRFAYHLGRRMPEYEFILGVRPKFEQFRARNSILEAATAVNARYTLMLDDDQVIGWRETNMPNEQYDFLRKLIAQMEKDEKLGIVGALYYHRGDECLAVLMKQGADGGYYYMRDDEIQSGLQEVAVTGGGCMLINMRALDHIPQPWFSPEFKYGTDVQICQKMHDAGYKVACDTAVVIGHVMTNRMVITPENRLQIQMQSQAGMRDRCAVDPKWVSGSSYNLYYLDAREYLGISDGDISLLFDRYQSKIEEDFPGRDGDLESYYKSRGQMQLARQLLYHATEHAREFDNLIFTLFRNNNNFYGVDYGCGSSHVGFELAMRGNKLDFVDLPGTEAYEFLKWRVKKRGLDSRCGWELGGPYDFILMQDSIEHLTDPAKTISEELAPRLKHNGVFITNYFIMDDPKNPEHISQDRSVVKKALIDAGIYPTNLVTWVKQNLGFMDKKEGLDGETSNSTPDDILRQQQESVQTP